MGRERLNTMWFQLQSSLGLIIWWAPSVNGTLEILPLAGKGLSFFMSLIHPLKRL